MSISSVVTLVLGLILQWPEEKERFLCLSYRAVKVTNSVVKDQQQVVVLTVCKTMVNK